MSNKESLQEVWENSDNLYYHMENAEIARNVIGHGIEKPEDGRFDIAFDVMASGKGQQSTVMMYGPPGTAKTKFGNLVFGSDMRIDMDVNDTPETLFGHPNPTDSEDIIQGKITKVGSLDREVQAVHVSDVGNNRNSRILNPMYDGDTMYAGGQIFKIGDLAALLSSNFPGLNVYALDESTLSRMAMQVLTGDSEEEQSRRIQGYIQSTNGDGPIFTSPLLPKASVRRTIHELVADNYPDLEDENREGRVVGNFAVDLGLKLNDSGILTPVSISDGRLGQAFRTVTRGYMFGQGVGAQEGRVNQVPITSLHAAKVAALVMPTMVDLSKSARHAIQEKIDGRINDLERAAIVRTVIARAAFELALQQDSQIRIHEDQTGRPRTQEDIRADIDRGVKNHAYVNQKAAMRPEVRSAITELINPSQDTVVDFEQSPGVNNGKRRIKIPKIARFRDR